MPIKFKVVDEVVNEFLDVHDFEAVCILTSLGNSDKSLAIFDYLNVQIEVIESGYPLEIREV